MPIASNHFSVILKVLENKNYCISEVGVSFSNLLEILENFTDLYGVWHLPQVSRNFYSTSPWRWLLSLISGHLVILHSQLSDDFSKSSVFAHHLAFIVRILVTISSYLYPKCLLLFFRCIVG